MKYELHIEGGFIGIPHNYQGDIVLDHSRQEELITLLEQHIYLPNEDLRDGLVYRLKVETDSGAYQTTFDDSDMPDAIRNLIKEIKSKK